jgi:hypothetical protein
VAARDAAQIQRLRRLARDLELRAPDNTEPRASLLLDQAAACRAGADALDRLASPDVVVVTRDAAEQALDEARKSGMHRDRAARATNETQCAYFASQSAEAEAAARRLLHLEER